MPDPFQTFGDDAEIQQVQQDQQAADSTTNLMYVS